MPISVVRPILTEALQRGKPREYELVYRRRAAAMAIGPLARRAQLN